MGWVDGWVVDGWMGGWVDGWMSGGWEESSSPQIEHTLDRNLM